ncbi:MAG: hypothetical protein HYW25_03410 [Candidatus Aenigmarchaeota archaeon]|nr:hypothetical protein [Candidatus Aenigmarchaeota archaeon]
MDKGILYVSRAWNGNMYVLRFVRDGEEVETTSPLKECEVLRRVGKYRGCETSFEGKVPAEFSMKVRRAVDVLP